MNIILLSELVNKKGGRIGGDYKIDQDDARTTSPTTPPVTTDDYVDSARQNLSFGGLLYRRFQGEEDETKKNVKIPKKKIKIPNKNLKKKVKENRERKLDELVNDVFSKKDFDRDILDKLKNSVSTLNGIPTLDVVKETNPILIRKVIALKDILEKNQPSGEEIAIILNYLLDVDMTKVPYEYKQELKKKIR